MKRFVLVLLAALAIWACNPGINPGPSSDPSKDAPASTDPSASDDPDSKDPGHSDDPSAETPESNDPEGPDFSPEDWYDTFFWDRTDREMGGIRGPVKSIHLSTPQYLNDRYNIYSFDEEGHLLKMEHIQTDTDIYNYSMTYTYDDKGRRTGMTYQAGSVTNGYTCEYENGDRYVAASGTNWIHMYGVFVGDGNGYANCQDLEGIWKGLSAVHFITEEELWNEQRDYTYVFDEEGNLTITLTYKYGQDKSDMSEETTVWNIIYKDGLPCSSTYTVDLGTYPTAVEWQSNGLPAKLVKDGGETYEYVPNDRTVLISKHYGYSDWGGMSGEEYFYDEHFDITGRDLDVKDEQFGLHHDSYSEYEYDRYGNWISRKEALTPIFWDGTEQGKSATTVLQVIEYFK